MTDVLVAAGVAFVVGGGIAGIVFWLWRRREGDVVARLAAEAQQAKAAEMSAVDSPSKPQMRNRREADEYSEKIGHARP